MFYLTFDNIILPPSKLCFANQGKLSFTIRNFLWSNPEYFKTNNPNEESFEYFESCDWYLKRAKKYSFAAKAGHNDESHNHNDVGNFIFADDSGQILADLGAMEYTKQNFNELRYTLIQNSSLGHSVPIIDGKEQKSGKEYCGKALVHTKDTFQIEIQSAYETDISKFVRTFNMLENGIELLDEFDRPENNIITERFISVIKPKQTDDGIKIGNALILAQSKPKIEKWILKDHYAKDQEVYIIDYDTYGEKFELKVLLSEN